jgi:L,D-transpeptidase-like protein/LysM domain-containing protein
MPQPRPSPSKLPTVLVVLACASIAAYVAFFRGKPADAAPPAPAPAPEQVAKAALAPAPAPEPVKQPPDKKETPKVEPAPPAPVQKSAVHEIEELCSQSRWREARAKLAPLFGSPLSDPERLDLARKGIEISQRLLQGTSEEKDVELYEIKQGDTLEGIARKFRALNGVKGAVMLVNNYPENAILRDGRKVRVPHGTWSVVVDKSLFKLWICYEGAPFKAYTITTGAVGKETPAVKFAVGGKNPKPAWWPPADVKVSGKVPVPYGDPQNPLGDWWIALDHDLYHGIGIHGTNDPGSIGSKASNGCVRMLNQEVGDVAAIAFKGMAVTVVE